jgi:hypothetical protein
MTTLVAHAAALQNQDLVCLAYIKSVSATVLQGEDRGTGPTYHY